jgi:cytochrome c-type biogenesis protein
MQNPQKLAFLSLRLGLAATYIYSGISLITEPSLWRAFVPFWFSDILPVNILTFLQVQGVIELLFAVAFILGILLRPVAFLSAFEMLVILALSGLDGITFRDLAILGASLALFFSTFIKYEKVSESNVGPPELVTAPERNLTDKQKRFRTMLVISAFVLFSVILVGLFWLSTTTRNQAGWLAFSYATGLSMIVLPCTLPLAFVIVPLAMGKNPKKGLAIALAFALGVTLMLSVYGAIIAKLGQVVGLDRAKDIMYLIAGGFAVIFGLGELGLIKLRVPTYNGAFPKFIQKRKDISKGFLLGLLLGNVGLGCPNPAFYVLLTHIATVGSVTTGWFLTFIHAVGRVTPLILLAILAVLGVDALSKLVKNKDSIARVTAWGVVGVGAFILTFGLLGHDWYVYSGIHSVLELVTQEAAFATKYAEQFGGLGHIHGVPSGQFLAYGSWLMVTLITIPLIWNWLSRKPKSEDENFDDKQSVWKWMGAYSISLALFLYLLFGVTLPNWFKYQVAPMHGDVHTTEMEETGDHAHDDGLEDAHEHGIDAEVNHHGSVSDLVNITLTTPAIVDLNASVDFEFEVTDISTGGILTELEISHGKPMHVVGVRKGDLNQFFHIHPELINDKFVVSHSFTDPGVYGIWAGIVYGGDHITIKTPDLTVGEAQTLSPEPDLNRTARLTDDLVVQLKGPSVVSADQDYIFGFAMTDSGGFYLPVGEYLEENMHINIINPDFEHYHHLHTNYGTVGGQDHGEHGDHSFSPTIPFVNVALAQHAHEDGSDHDHEQESVVDDLVEELIIFDDNDLQFQFNFPDPGLYRVFGEFVLVSNPEEIHRAEFWVDVEEANTRAVQATSQSKGTELPKWALALISLALIAVVMPFVHRYLKEDNIKV